MPTIEIDEEEFQKNTKLRALVTKLMGNKKSAALVEQAHKLIDPNAPTPTLDAQAPIDEKFDAVSKELKEFKEAAAKEKSEAEQQRRLDALNGSIEKGIDGLRRAGWTDDGIKGVRELMEKKGLLDVEDAAVLFEKMNPPQAPVKPGGVGGWNFLEAIPDGDADIKALIASKGDNELIVNKMANDALNDMRSSAQRR